MTTPAAPPSLTEPPSIPTREDPVNFPARGDAFNSWFATMRTELVAALANVYANAVAAYDNAVSALASAAAAAASQLAAASSAAGAATSAGAPLWTAATYAAGDARRDPSTMRVYIRRTAGASATAPAADPTGWKLYTAGGLPQVKHTGTSATLEVNTDALFSNAAAWAATAPPVLDVGDELVLRWDNQRVDNTLDIGTENLTHDGIVRSGVITLNQRGIVKLRYWGAANGGWRFNV